MENKYEKKEELCLFMGLLRKEEENKGIKI